MPDELRDSLRHATFSSLKATHTPHRVADKIYSHPTQRLRSILKKKERMYPSNVPPEEVIPEPEPEAPEHPFIRQVVLFILLFTVLVILAFFILALAHAQRHPTATFPS